MEQGRFRLVLYYRIGAVSLEVPRLAERPGDVPLLVHHFLSQLAETHDRPPPELAAEAETFLSRLPWPGKVRQFRHAVERALIFAEGATLTPANFAHLAALVPAAAVSPAPAAPPPAPLPEPAASVGTRLRDAQ